MTGFDGFQEHLPILLPKQLRKALYVSSGLGKEGLDIYKETFEKSFDFRMETKIENWKKTKIDKHANQEARYYHGDVNFSAEEWNELISFLNFESDSNKKFNWLEAFQNQEGIMKEMIALFKNEESKEPKNLCNLYLSLFQPNFDILIEKSFLTERNDVKRKMVQLRENPKFESIKPNQKIVERILNLIQ